ncbi:MAG: hypothetical protein IJ678_02585, partial [Kiritimatiellae bacterium]|nr:hypothetical protein [Kiritimatiellia bacterium]
ALALAALLGFRILASGMPESWVARIEEAVSTEALAVELSGVSFSLPRMTLRCGSVRLFPRGKVHEPVAAATGVGVRLHPKLGRPEADWVRSVSVDSVSAILPEAGLFPESEGGAAVVPDFPPVRVFCRRAVFEGLEAHRLEGRLSARGGRVELRDARASFADIREPAQDFVGKVAFAPALPAVEASGRGRLLPSKIVPILRSAGAPGVANEILMFEFRGDAPSANATYEYAPAAGRRFLRIDVRGRDAEYNGVSVSAFRGRIEVSGDGGWNRATFGNLRVERPEGALDGVLEVDSAAGTLGFSCTSSIDPARLAAIVRIVRPEENPPLVFGSPARLEASGTYDLECGPGEPFSENGATNRTDISLAAALPSATVRGFEFSDISATARLKGGRFEIPSAEAQAMGGRLSARGAFALAGGTNEETRLACSFDLRDVPHARWAHLIGQDANAAAGGWLDLSVTLDGPLADIATGAPVRTSGTVAADVREAHVFRVPLFAGLTDLLAERIPGVDFLVDQNEASLRAALSGGRFDVSRLSVSGSAFSMDGHGTVRPDGSDLDAVLQVHLMNRGTWVGRRLYEILSPISRIFALRASGSVAEPRWSAATLGGGGNRRDSTNGGTGK